MRYHLGILAAALSFVTACDYNKPEDYNPKSDFEAYKAAEQKAQEAAKMNPVKEDPAVAMAKAAAKDYNTYCSSCHGADGAANSPTAMALNPKPRNFTDKAWQDSVDDAHIYKVIDEGGPAVGLSPTMAPWGAALNDEKIKALVQYVRSFAK
ncbi:c-type cytochrome [Pseudobacteriovorax antillogorgiicola]|uniref:Cytochrome C oxidase, cbb3-type, subunit III n=1 Tax=Pseudobacteriovorax antillogorgiicola TaxID=1513793 RepID=A0A1Y6CFV5_9BACT|nr:cytochrome c [Pseudobacteriovorax antillogorgiicola]TCS47316.1 cbb3-type cytochrome c oxidase subunit III [Pseudobacteriovorax antillogorgiicola]SMF62769.1 Cytochrome C oxidase, cbb3-type, subunit III [Pseudobacteriovorax antillogorgiicola]